jgi:hypothetical protein
MLLWSRERQERKADNLTVIFEPALNTVWDP